MNNIKHKIVTDMCFTLRHDYGLHRDETDTPTCGMTEREREALYNSMSQVYDHHIAQLVDALVDVEVTMKANTALHALLNDTVIERTRTALPTL